MNKKMVITLGQVCECFKVDIQTVRDLAEFGLYPIVSLDGEFAIEISHLDRVERVISLNQTLGINKEGIDIILDLREEISTLQEQIKVLQNGTEQWKSGFARGRLVEVVDY